MRDKWRNNKYDNIKQAAEKQGMKIHKIVWDLTMKSAKQSNDST